MCCRLFSRTGSLWCYDAQIRHGYNRDTAWRWVLYIKSKVSDMIWHDMLSLLKYPCIINSSGVTSPKIKWKANIADALEEPFLPILKYPCIKYSFGVTSPKIKWIANMADALEEPFVLDSFNYLLVESLCQCNSHPNVIIHQATMHHSL